MDAFDRWCFIAIDPNAPVLFGQERAPVLTTLLYRVCENNHDKFDEAVRLVRLAFEAGQESGRKEKETESGE